MHPELRAFPSAERLAHAAAHYVADQARRAITDRGTFVWAVSGGRTPGRMFEQLVALEVSWRDVVLYQVDERVAPRGSPERNLTDLEARFAPLGVRIEPMGVDDDDLDGAAQRYAEQLPERFDLIHLGLGPDGHTASLVPGDPALEVHDRLVTMSQPYQGRRRMTLTYRALARGEQLLWLVSGSDKCDALAQLLGGDHSIPAARVQGAHSVIMADRAASPA